VTGCLRAHVVQMATGQSRWTSPTRRAQQLKGVTVVSRQAYLEYDVECYWFGTFDVKLPTAAGYQVVVHPSGRSFGPISYEALRARRWTWMIADQ
jgi:hypothetical protein